ncbi:hypothetical protein [Agromyces allii]|uniref:DUF2382 domain-containing protein n=1 Tax=Agromyces allii TaxID=393607 RepID=A0ABP5C4I0_9MICO|nr:hypothetical protein [Agromyces allii]
MTAANPGEVLDAGLEADETIVVDRRARITEPPVGDAPEPGREPVDGAFDETIVVSRVPAPVPPVPAGPAAVTPFDLDETIVVERTGTGPVATGPAVDGPAGTVPAVAGQAAVDDTIVLERTVVRATPLPTDEPDAVMHAPTRRGRRVTPAPVSDDVLSTAEVGAGPGLLEHYAARPIEPAAPRLAPLSYAGGPEPTRDPAQALPSVARSSRRSARVVLAVFAGSCAIAVVGLVVVVVLAFGV